jgi:hypothetical protein
MMSVRKLPTGQKLIALVLFTFLYTFLLRFLWNNVLVNAITVIRPIKTLWQTLLLAIALTLWRLQT